MFNKSLLSVLLFVLLTSGCAVTHKKIKEKSPVLPSKEIVLPQPDSSPELQNLQVHKQEAEKKLGVIFAKTDFRGSLATNYVKLIIENLNNSNEKYQLHIGDKSAQVKFPWEVKAVEPGYFFIELPEGNYKFSSVSIPVGSTLATENLNITFSVAAEKIYYLGTLRLIGTKETIRLGGVPIIRPGFDYDVVVHDEYEQGVKEFYKRYPKIQPEIIKQIMRVQQKP